MALFRVRDENGNIYDIPALKGEPGNTPIKGEDYFTEEDKQEIAELAADIVDAVKTVNGSTPDSNGNVEINFDTLPTVSSADNGKILMVVDGVWKAVNITMSVDSNGVAFI